MSPDPPDDCWPEEAEADAEPPFALAEALADPEDAVAVVVVDPDPVTVDDAWAVPLRSL